MLEHLGGVSLERYTHARLVSTDVQFIAPLRGWGCRGVLECAT